MKLLLTIIFILNSIVLLGQKIKPYTGYYLDRSVNYHADNRLFHFGEDSSFVFMWFTNEVHFGIGKYKVKNGMLTLNFTSSGLTENIRKTLTELKISTGVSDSLAISLDVFSVRENDKLIGAGVSVQNTSQGSQTNENGRCEFVIRKYPDQKFALEINWLTHKSLVIPLENNVSEVKGKVYLTDVYFYKTGDILTFKLENWNSSKLTVAKSAYYETSDTVYKKQTTKKIEKWLGDFYYSLFTAYIPSLSSANFEN